MTPYRERRENGDYEPKQPKPPTLPATNPVPKRATKPKPKKT